MSARTLLATLLLLSWLTACSGLPQKQSHLDTPTVSVASVDLLCPSDNEKAMECFDQALALERLSRLEQAKGLYLKSIELDPGFCDAMDNVGRIFRQQGHLNQAIAHYQMSIGVLPENPVAHTNLGVAYRLAERLDDARDTYQRLTQLAPDNPEGYYGLAQVYAAEEQWALALTQYEEAEKLYAAQNSVWVDDARIGLAECYLMTDNFTQARDYLERAYPAYQDDAVINYWLGLCYLSPELADIERATKYLRIAEQLGLAVAPELFSSE